MHDASARSDDQTICFASMCIRRLAQLNTFRLMWRALTITSSRSAYRLIQTLGLVPAAIAFEWVLLPDGAEEEGRREAAEARLRALLRFSEHRGSETEPCEQRQEARPLG